MKNNRLTKRQKENATKKYLTGKFTYSELARYYGISCVAMYKMLKRRGIKTTFNKSEFFRKYTLNESYFDNIDCEEKAYFLGFLYADGYNNEKRNRFHLTLQEKDKHILEKFSELIGSNKPLFFHKKRKESQQNQYILSIVSKNISEKLNKLGCYQKKSLTLKFPTNEQVSDILIHHFVRGFFDGDGCINIFKRKDRKTGYAITPTLCSTYIFCDRLKEIVEEKLNIYCGRYIRKNSCCFQVSGNKQAKKFLDWIYKDATVYLTRKHDKYRDFYYEKRNSQLT